MPTFENGWICRECWSANREQDQRCYRCHAVPKLPEMPAATTFSATIGVPKDEPREDEPKRVSRLTAPPAPRPVEPAPVKPTPSGPPWPVVVFSAMRSWFARPKAGARRVARVARAVPGAPGAGLRLVSGKLNAGVSKVTSPLRRIFANRRAWLSAAWVVSALSCALLFSAALQAPLAASLLVVVSVAIFSGLTSALTTNASERRNRRAGDVPVASVIPPTTPPHPAQAAEILGTRAGH
jgi:hypothetical protein